MLKGLPLVAVCAIATAAPIHAASVDGAFGLQFDAIAPPHRLGAGVTAEPPPAPFTWQLPPDAPPDFAPQWLQFLPTAVPRLLDAIAGSYTTHLDEGVPLRIVARLPGACDSKREPLTAVLARKYPPLPAADGDVGSASWFGDARTRAGIYCDLQRDALVLDYLDVARYRIWEALTRDRYTVWQDAEIAARAAADLLAAEAAEQARLEAIAHAERIEAAHLAELERIRIAAQATARAERQALMEALIIATPRRIESLFGVVFRQPFGEVAGIHAGCSAAPDARQSAGAVRTWAVQRRTRSRWQTHHGTGNILSR
ncbi:MAG: hypothetical protein HC809_05485 [Gammaproteobacteria bacterium]|nr:hypothetical protein [Gammaproteobacteria bacterium]